MASNSFGTIFRITTWGESHGPALGVVIDGCPAGVPIEIEDIQKELDLRRPGIGLYTSSRREPDRPEILSGVFNGETTGAPISIVVFNKDVKSSSYSNVKEVHRPGHASYTYQEKYGIFDHRGGGRASARETLCRVAAGAFAKKILEKQNIALCAFLSKVGDIEVKERGSFAEIKEKKMKSSLFCPDELAEEKIKELLLTTKASGDSIGGVVSVITSKLPVGLGDPIYEKIHAKLSFGMLSIPAARAIGFGKGFNAVGMYGSAHNDGISIDQDKEVCFLSNNAGGVLGGISNGAPLFFEVAFKPTSTTALPQKTIDHSYEEAVCCFATTDRHDPCVAIRAVAVVEAMTALVLVDALLLNKSARL